MINKKRINKLMSITLTISLLVSLLIPCPARAEPTGGSNPTPISEIQRRLTIDYLGYDEEPESEATVPPNLSYWWVNDPLWLPIKQLIWIGVAVDKIHDLDLFTQGIFNLEIGFDYDPEYLEPYTDTDTGKTWEQMLQETNFRSGVSNTDNTYWNSTYYELEKVLTNVDIVTDVDREDIEDAEANKAAGWKMCYVQIDPSDRNSLVTNERRFYDTTDEDEDEGKQYLIRMPFRLKKVPPNGEHPIVLKLTRGPTTFVIGSDESGTMPYAAWEQTVQRDEDDAHNLKTMFGFGGDVDLFSDHPPYIQNITAFQGNPATGEEAEEYNLYHDITLDDYGFRDGIMDYYIEVPNTTDSLEVKITGAYPHVTHNGNEIFVQLEGTDDDKYITEKIKLIAFNPDEDIGADAYEKNIIKVTYGDDTTVYTLHVKRLPAEPVHDDQDIGLKVTKGDPEEELTLTTNDYTTSKDFVVEDTSDENPNEYWVRVDKDTDTVKIHVTADDGSTVTIDGTNTPLVNGVATQEITDLKPVIETNDDGTLKKDADGNVIINGTRDVVVTVGTNTYTVHIQRLGEGGGIDLNPGNSPYGMIERMREKYHGADGAWTSEQIKAVKNKLFEHDTTPTTERYKFRNILDVDGTPMDALPDGADTSIIYNPKAWGNEEYAYFGSTTEINTVFDVSYDPKYNLDMDDNALFIYQHTPFVDPGIITAYDEAGQPIDLTEEGVSVKVAAKDIVRLNGNMLYDIMSTADVELELDTNDKVENLTTKTITNLIRPDVYKLEYEITRNGKDPIVAQRNLILLAKRCDADINGDFNGSDLTVIKNGYLKQQLQLLGTKTDSELKAAGVDVELKNLYVYRILDSDLNSAINGSDITMTKDVYLKAQKTPGKIQLYPMFNKKGEIVE